MTSTSAFLHTISGMSLSVTSCFDMNPRYRPVTNAHAVDLILRICPHHPTLLYLILETCLSHNLGIECDTVLEALLVAAVSPGSAGPPLCHPTHGTYLLDICAIWKGTGRNERRFFAILTDVLVRFGNQDSWTCKALQNLISQVCTEDIVPVFDIAFGLVQVLRVLVEQPGAKRRKKCAREDWDNPTRAALEGRLVAWIQTASRYAFNASGKTLIDSEAERCSIVLRFLSEAQEVGLHRQSSIETRDESYLPHALVTLATLCLSRTASLLSVLSYEVEILVNILRQAIPTTRLYDNLIASALGRISRNASHSQVQDLRHILQKHASSLRAHRLFQLEASLWACALRYVEDLDEERAAFLHANHRQLENLRGELMVWVEEAERRCFGFEKNGVLPLSSQSDDPDGQDSEPEWVWEEFVGCWVRKTQISPTATRVKPVYPRRHAAPHTLLRSAGEYPTLFQEKLSVTPSLSPSSSFALRTPPTPPLSLDVEEESLCPSSPLAPLVDKTKISRRKTNFESILADSLRNRIILHPKDTNHPINICTLPQTPVSKSLRHPISETHTSSPVWSISFNPSSDDALDLFTRNSSPPPSVF